MAWPYDTGPNQHREGEGENPEAPAAAAAAPSWEEGNTAGTTAIKGWYKQYLGRDAASDDAAKWLSGAYGWGDSKNLAGIEQGIKSSAEAQAYAARNGPNYNDPASIVAGWMQSNNPQGHQDADYWVRRINETGGLRADNVNYWLGRFTEAPGTHVEGPSGSPAVTNAPGAPSGGPGSDSSNALLQYMMQMQQQAQAQRAAEQARTDALYQTLVDRSNQSLQVNPNDPNIKQQVDPYAAQVERQKRNYLGDLAERQGPLANLGGETRLASEHAGQDIGGFQARLIGGELAAQRDEVQNALAQMGGMLSDQQRNTLQSELAQLNTAMAKYSADMQNAQFGQSLGQQNSQFLQSLGQNAWQFNANLGQQNSQFGQRLGFDYANMDNSTMQLLLQLLGRSS